MITWKPKRKLNREITGRRKGTQRKIMNTVGVLQKINAEMLA